MEQEKKKVTVIGKNNNNQHERMNMLPQRRVYPYNVDLKKIAWKMLVTNRIAFIWLLTTAAIHWLFFFHNVTSRWIYKHALKMKRRNSKEKKNSKQEWQRHKCNSNSNNTEIYTQKCTHLMQSPINGRDAGSAAHIVITLYDYIYKQ